MAGGLWLSLTYRDAEAAAAWLRAVGFTEQAIHRDATDPGVVVHAEMTWPSGGGVMFGTFRGADPSWPKQPGTGASYVVTDDVDGAYAAALAAGGSPLRPPADQDYGGRSAAVADPEGNLWSFGTYEAG